MIITKITCDNCDKIIDNYTAYGTLILPGFTSQQFCGWCCFDDWILNVYMKNRENTK